MIKKIEKHEPDWEGNWMSKAGVIIAVLMNKKEYNGDYPREVGANAFLKMLQAAYALGLGVCWSQRIVLNYSESISYLLYIPDGLVLHTLISVGVQAHEIEREF